MSQNQSSSSVSSQLIQGPPCHCSRRTVLLMSWTDANPGRRFYRCNQHGFFKWADTEDATEWQKLSLLEARDRINRLKDENKSLFTEIAELQRQLALQAAAQEVNRPVEVEINETENERVKHCSNDTVWRQMLVISWAGFIATTAIIIFTLKH